MIKILTWTDLDNIRNNLAGEYLLARDLFSTDSDYVGIGDNWIPIGEGGMNPFTGIFNGGGHKIHNLIINRPGESNVGLFRFILGDWAKYGEIRISNLGLIDVDIIGNSAGSLAGRADVTFIDKCYSTGNVYGADQAGGLVAFTFYGTTSNSYSECVVSGNYHSGGLIGEVRNGYVINCYATGDVNGVNGVGGLTYYSDGSPIINCFATGKVSGDNSVGGLVGNGRNLFVATNCGWFYNPGYVTKAIGGGAQEAELITYNIKDGGGIGYIDDTVDWFYDKTRDIYNVTSPVWNFIRIWREQLTNYPKLIGRTSSPFPIFKRS